MTDLCSMSPLLSSSVWFMVTLIPASHLHPPQCTLTSCATAWPPTRSAEVCRLLQIKHRWNFRWGVWGRLKTLSWLFRKTQKCGHTHILDNEELIHCSQAVGWVCTASCWSSDSGHCLKWRGLNFLNLNDWFQTSGHYIQAQKFTCRWVPWQVSAETKSRSLVRLKIYLLPFDHINWGCVLKFCHPLKLALELVVGLSN